MRAATVAILNRRRAEGLEVIQRGITEHLLDARPTVRAYAYLTDCVVGAAFHVATRHLHPMQSRTPPRRSPCWPWAAMAGPRWRRFRTWTCCS